MCATNRYVRMSCARSGCAVVVISNREVCVLCASVLCAVYQCAVCQCAV